MTETYHQNHVFFLFSYVCSLVKTFCMIMVVINNIIIKANVGCNEIEPNVVNYEMCQSRKKKVK